MIIQIDRELKITLLKALQDGYLDTLDIPQLYKEYPNFFYDCLVESNQINEDEAEY